jgi:hypothetical protein
MKEKNKWFVVSLVFIFALMFKCCQLCGRPAS